MKKKLDHEYLAEALRILKAQGGSVHYAQDSGGLPVDALSRDAVKFNAFGAIRRACGAHRAAERRICRGFRAFLTHKVAHTALPGEALAKFAKVVQEQGGAY